jgi:hypothetical protein
MLAVKATGLQNMLTIDGRGLSWPPVPGVWLGVNEGPHGISATGDARLAYSFGKVMQVHPLGSASGKLPYYAPFTEGNFDLSRDLQIAFHPETVKWNDGYAHTDYGPWSGETRLVEHYDTNNPVDQADRTVHLARGAHPYVLLLDDARKSDTAVHLFEASFNLPNGVVVVDAKSTEIQYQNVEPSERRESEFLLALADARTDPKTGRPMPKKGDPLMLVRVLHRNSDYGYPAPRVQVLPGRPEQPFNQFSQLVVPAMSRSPEFRILFYPHRHGDPLPVTAWNPDRTALSVTFGDQRDYYQFTKTDGGRTVFNFTRDAAPGLANNAAPARPVLLVRGDRYDAFALRETRRVGETPIYPFFETIHVAFERVIGAAEIRYTLDGSAPSVSSPRFVTPFAIRSSTSLRACVFDPAWPGKNRRSVELSARFEQTSEAPGQSRPAGSKNGLLARVYEINTKLWDERGFFRANKIMLPDLDTETPLVTAAASDGFALPHAVPAASIREQTKGFYRLTGFYEAQAAGAYTFAVDSCGPVLLNVGGQDAVSETGVFHQQQALRKGTVMLGRGWHPLEIIVTDPLFWNLATTGVMPFSVTVRGPDDVDFNAVPVARLATLLPANAGPSQPALIWKVAAALPGPLEPGVIQTFYEREGLTRETAYLDIDEVTPRRRETADEFADNTNPAQVVVYDAWFQAPVDGIYAFQLPSHRAEFVHLGGFRSAYQSQLRISGDVVVQRGVAGRVASARIGLKAGWHPISLRLGSSSADLTVTYPDGQTVRLDASSLHRVAGQSFPVPSPDAALIAGLDFSKWDGKTGIIPLDDRCRVWTADFAKSAKIDGRDALVSPPLMASRGPESVDINLTRSMGRVPLKLHFLKMRDPEFTVGLWFRSDTGEGILFGKSGLTVFGKSYRTVMTRVGRGKLYADPGALAGGKIDPGRWYHVVLTATPKRLGLHLDGMLIDEAPGRLGLTTDSLDFLTDHTGALAGVTIHNRELSADEIAAWYGVEKR